jgi:hypothetical protein
LKCIDGYYLDKDSEEFFVCKEIGSQTGNIEDSNNACADTNCAACYYHSWTVTSSNDTDLELCA